MRPARRSRPFSKPPLKDRVELPEGFRHIAPADAKAHLETGEPLIDRRGFRHFLEESRNPGSLVIVKDVGGVPAALVHVTVHSTYMMVEVLARTRRAARGSGAQLLAIVERYVAPALGVHEIRLDAMNEELASYYRRMGFERVGTPYEDSEWGRLIPMRKRLP